MKVVQCDVVYLKHGDCELVAKHVRALFEEERKRHKLTWHEPANAVLLRAAPEEIEQMKSLISRIDVPEPEEEEILAPQRRLEIMAIQHAKADELADLLRERG
jgi:hypothetical protein